MVLLAAVTTSCRRRSVPQQVTKAQPATTTLTNRVEPLKPLQAAQPQVQLELPDTPATSLVIPRGITAKAPLVVILGEPKVTLQARCATWATALPAGHFVLCQAVPNASDASRGARERADKEPLLDVTFDAARALKIAFRAVKRRFGAYVGGETVTLVGVGDGASLVPALMRQSPAFFPRVALIEQGFDAWSAVDSALLSEVPSAKVLVVCSSESCAPSATRVAVTLKSSGTAVELRLSEALAVRQASDVASGLPSHLGRTSPPRQDISIERATNRPKSVVEPLALRDALAQLLRPEPLATK